MGWHVAPARTRCRERRRRESEAARRKCLALLGACCQCALAANSIAAVGFIPPQAMPARAGGATTLESAGMLCFRACARRLVVAMGEGLPAWEHSETAASCGRILRQRESVGALAHGVARVPWTHLLELSSLWTVDRSPVEERLAEWRAGSLAVGGLESGAEAADWTSLETSKKNLLTSMRWERVLAAEVDIGLKLSLWKSQARARRHQQTWNVGNAMLSLDFERSTVNKLAQKGRYLDSIQARPQPPASPPPVQNNVLPGRKGGRTPAASFLQHKSRSARSHVAGSVVSFTQEMTRTSEPDALATGVRLLREMERRKVRPTTIFFNALLGACTGKSVLAGQGRDGRRGPASSGKTRGTVGGGAAFTVRQRASTGSSRVAVAAGRGAAQRWRDCSEVLQLMRSHAVFPDTASMNILVDACVKQGGAGGRKVVHVEQALCILEAFSQAHPHAPPDAITYTSLLTGCAGVLRDSPQRALTASAGVHARGEEPVRRTLSDSTEQVKGAVRVAAKVLGRMETQGVSPNAVTCTAALEVGVYVVLRSPIDSPAHKLGAVVCENIIRQMQNLPQMLGDGHTRRDMTYALNLVLRALSRQLGAVRKGERAVLDVIELLLMEGAAPDLISYNTMLHRLLLGADDTMQAARARLLAQHMHATGVAADVVSYTTLINICAQSPATPYHFIAGSRLLCAAMRREGLKPNAATSAAFAAGLVATSGRRGPLQARLHEVEGDSASQRRLEQSVDLPTEARHSRLHGAVAAFMEQQRRREVQQCGDGPRGAELIRAMLALNMRPDASSCTSLLRASAARSDGGFLECVRLMEAMRGAGASPTLQWYHEAAAAAKTVTHAAYLVHLSRQYLQSDESATEVQAVCDKLVRTFCLRRNFTGLAQGWTVVLSELAAGQRVRPHWLTLLVETAQIEGSTQAELLSHKLLTAVDRDSGRAGGQMMGEARGLLLEGLRAAGMDDEAKPLHTSPGGDGVTGGSD